MDRDEFKEWLAGEPAVWRMIQESASTIPPNTMGVTDKLTDDIILAVMYPVVSFVLREIGLPWHYDGKEYADRWRGKFRGWLEAEADDLNLHPYAIESAGTELRRRLNELSDRSEQVSWERLAQRIA